MKVLLTPIGSHGDVHPFMGMGLELKSRGHEAIVIANSAFRRDIERVGLTFVEVGCANEFREITSDPLIWHPIKGFRLACEKLIIPLMRPLYERIAEQYEPGRTVVVHSPLGLGARVANEKLKVPLATVHIAPATIRSVALPSVLPGVALSSQAPRWLWRAGFWLVDKALVDPHLTGPLNRFRRELGLPPVSRPLASWWNSPQRILCLFPDWFGPIQQDWPPQTRHTGFLLYDDPGQGGISEELDRFLQTGEQPVIFTPGSAMAHGQRFFRAAVQACCDLRCRALFLTSFTQHLPRRLPENIFHASYIPFRQVFSRAAAVVHHGGSGTTGQGLAAGIPQLVMPMGFDQPDNAARLQRLGVGAVLSPRKFTGGNLRKKLEALLNGNIRERCRDLAHRLSAGNALAETCGLIEALPVVDAAV